jgi:hypothetical protein
MTCWRILLVAGDDISEPVTVAGLEAQLWAEDSSSSRTVRVSLCNWHPRDGRVGVEIRAEAVAERAMCCGTTGNRFLVV